MTLNELARIVNTLACMRPAKAVDQCNQLVKYSIKIKSKDLLKHAIKHFIKMVRSYKQYKEFISSKKLLELTLIRQILTDHQFIEYAQTINSTQYVIFFLKEFHVSYKQQVFSSLEMVKKTFH